MLTLYHNPQSRSTTAHYMLHELGEPFEIVPIDLKAGEHKKPEFLKINPMGKIPVLRDGDVIITENAGDPHLSRRQVSEGWASRPPSTRRSAPLTSAGCSSTAACFEPACVDMAH